MPARILEAGRTHIGPSIGLALLAALLLSYALGYSASAWILGRSIVRGPTAWVVAFLVGWAILRVVALIPILGGLVHRPDSPVCRPPVSGSCGR